MLAAVFALLLAAAPMPLGGAPAPPGARPPPSGAAAQITGRVVDAVSGRSVRLAVVTALRGQVEEATVLTDDFGWFALDRLAAGPIVLVVQHPSYQPFSAPGVTAVAGQAARVELKVPPSALEAEQVEIVDTREETLRPMLLRQADFVIPLSLRLGWKGGELTGLYRVCVAQSGKVVLVAALEPAPMADAIFREGILNGWEYRPLSAPSCFSWRVHVMFPRVPPAGLLPPSGDSFRR